MSKILKSKQLKKKKSKQLKLAQKRIQKQTYIDNQKC